MAHEVVVVSRRQAFQEVASRLLGADVHPIPTRDWSLDRTFDGRPLTVVLDILQLAIPVQVESLPPLPRRLPTLLAVGFRRDADAIIMVMNQGIAPLVAEDLSPGALAHAACPSESPSDLYARWGRLAAE